MKSPASIKLKAAFALIVFSLNTVVGFACFAGLDMGYNSTHHAVPAATGKIAHIHKEDQGPTHHAKKGIYGQDRSPNNDQATNTQKSKSDKGKCVAKEDSNKQLIAVYAL